MRVRRIVVAAAVTAASLAPVPAQAQNAGLSGLLLRFFQGANPIAQRLGIATVKLVTASASTDATIPGLPVEEAHELRDRLSAKGEALSAGL